jgi:Protein of unknown function (DUF4058)
MPIHDWTRVDAGLFHDFHQDWTIELCRSLNAGRLKPGFAALAARKLEKVAAAPPKARFVVKYEEDVYARRANRIKIQHRHGRIVAVIEIVSPGNKSSRNALRAFVRTASDLIWNGIHLLVVDLFPPSERDPQGIHQAIGEELGKEPFELPPDKPLTVVAYQAVPEKVAYVEPVAVGDPLPGLGIFLSDDGASIPAPLEETYMASWAAFPDEFKELLEPASNART